ncbi:MAG: IPT/TIG domain-containing protein [Planctomycetes bacterium]|nr:IPT/TIG domain-containing protein [Planctomycetota bacterium]MBI3843150.1 IPT/TIG domain-containing protein [Planctomycetota bacterium]
MMTASTRLLLRLARTTATFAILAAALPATAQVRWVNRSGIADLPAIEKLAFDSVRARTVLVGKRDNATGPLETWEWDGASWIERFPTSRPTATQSFVTAFDSVRGRLVLFADDGETWEWDGNDWSRRSPTTRPTRRFAPAMAFDAARGRTVLFGGYRGSGPLADTWLWDGTDWTLATPATSPSARSAHAMAFDSTNGRILLFGGIDPSGYVSDTWEWDGATWIARSPAHSPYRRANAGLAHDPARARTVLYGGVACCHPDGMTDTWEWDGVDWAFVNPTQSPGGGSLASLSADVARGRIVFHAGFGLTWEWDGTTWRLVLPPGTPPAQAYHALTFDSDHARTLLVGFDRSGTSTSEWDGSAWTRRHPTTSPPLKLWASLTYDARRHRAVRFGGRTPGSDIPTAETWEWDGVDWTQRFPATTPPARSSHATVFDPDRGVTVMFGGLDATYREFADTWEWNGNDWRLRTPTTSPPPHESHGMAYDSLRHEVVLFGGRTNGFEQSDTWEWNGSDWAQRNPTVSPPARGASPLAFDAARGLTVLFGGSKPGIEQTDYLDDTWEWDGVTWTERTFVPRPGARDSHAMAYDSARSRVVLFGGYRGFFFPDTWELELAPTATAIEPSTGSEAGGDLVVVSGAAFGSDTTVEFGGVAATVVSAAPGRLLVRTPSGSGGVAVRVGNGAGSSELPAAFTYVSVDLAARYGNVNAGVGARENVLLVNAAIGDPFLREALLGSHDPIQVAMVAPSSRTSARFALYAWPGAPTAATLRALPHGAGFTVFPTPISGGAPRPTFVFNNLGHVSTLGAPTQPSSPAPSIVIRGPLGARRALTATLQGLIEDDGSRIPAHVSVTNAVILRIGP